MNKKVLMQWVKENQMFVGYEIGVLASFLYLVVRDKILEVKKVNWTISSINDPEKGNVMRIRADGVDRFGKEHAGYESQFSKSEIIGIVDVATSCFTLEKED